MSLLSAPVSFTGRRAPATTLRVAFVAMPFASCERPSIQIGLLKAIVDRGRHQAQTFHLNVEFAHALEGSTDDEALQWYREVAEARFALGDWFFSGEAFGDDAADPMLMLDQLLADESIDATDVDSLLDIRRTVVPAYLDHMLELVAWSEFDVIGFTSTFQQNVASFAFARRLRTAAPDALLLFGGANFDAGMGEEWVRSMPCIDYAIQGEADHALPAFLDALSRGEDPLAVPGVIGRRDGAVVATPPAPISGLDDSPTPDYTEYFERIDALGTVDRLAVSVPHEAARLLVAARRHCTFCGLNGQTMDFRSKSPRQVLNELTTLALKHKVLRFNAVDNIIDMQYFDRLLPELAAKQRPFRLFYETKADLDAAQLALLAGAGVDQIQPGIESLSSHVLGLMRKGTRAIWNVNLLRWALHHGIHVHWNLIWGFPGEHPEDATDQLVAIDRLVHLTPPGGSGRVWMERFSPLFTETDRFPTTSFTPERSYHHVYPDRVDLHAAAYFFDYQLENTLGDEVYAPLARAVTRWNALARAEEPPSLHVEDLGDRLVVHDRRDPATPKRIELTGLARDVHRACMTTWRRRAELSEELGVSQDDLAAAIDELDREGLVFLDYNLCVALALPMEPAAVRGRMIVPGRSLPPNVLRTRYDGD